MFHASIHDQQCVNELGSGTIFTLITSVRHRTVMLAINRHAKQCTLHREISKLLFDQKNHLFLLQTREFNLFMQRSSANK